MAFREIGEGSVEHAQNVWRDVINRDFRVLLNERLAARFIRRSSTRIECRQVVVEEIVQFGGEFNACGATTDDCEVEEPVAILWGCCGQGGLFEVGENALADATGV